MMPEKNIERAAEVLHNANALLITAGAGIGVDSGLPDFRGNEGFWRAYPPLANLGISFSQMANPEWFLRNPKLAWGFYGHRLNLYRQTIPHQGFHQLLEIGQQKKGGYFVFTSNVDGQFQKAGYDDHRIEECHGSIHHLQCVRPCQDEIWTAENTEVIVDETTFEAQDPLPHCINCKALARPNILMFGDWYWIGTRSQHQSRQLNHWLQTLYEQDLTLAIMEVGAGKAVPTVRYMSETTIQRLKATLIRINPRDDDVPSGHISIPLGGGEGIQRIYDMLTA